jgi:stearoyl-CoA desaturase (delta-9 desaturase)
MEKKGYSLPVNAGLVIIHLGAIGAFFPMFFSWSGVAVAVALWWLTGAVGIALCFHRALTHRSITMSKPLEYFAALCGTLALQGDPITWVATHRLHHAHADKQGDPHDAHRGLWWTHIDWLYMPNDSRPTEAEQERHAPDLWAQPYYRFLHTYAPLLQVALGLVLVAVGGWSWLIWGVFVRLVFVYHVTWLVNSASHKFGYKSYKTEDLSTNCWWVAILTWGEGWHNNHHAFPFSARHGLRWFEFDLTWLQIKLLRALRLVSNVKLPSAEMLARRANKPQPPDPALSEA